jgi:methionine-rich copper-binding protein CopC
MRDFAIAGLLVFVAGGAHAHAFLSASSPPVGASTAAPSRLNLSFTEPVELALSGIDLANVNGRAVKLGALTFASNDHKVLSAALPPLPPGAYRVRWHVVSTDTHRTEGEFRFTVKP